MSGKLRDYQVLDVLCGGKFYKVKHKETSKIFAWRAYDCSPYSNNTIKCISEDVESISKLQSDNLLQYHETIIHMPSKTLYFVMEFSGSRTLSHLMEECVNTGKNIAEGFVWHVLRELAKVCKLVVPLQLRALHYKLSTKNIFVNDDCQLIVNCFNLDEGDKDIIHAVGEVTRSLIHSKNCYSEDLHEFLDFLTDNSNLSPDVILYHPTVLVHLENYTKLDEALFSDDIKPYLNKCDSEKAVELCKSIEPLPRCNFGVLDSPIYSNISPKRKLSSEYAHTSPRVSISPTLQALALELPGFVPRSRKPVSQALAAYKPRQISQDTLSQQWMSRLVALRQREESLNQRERDLIKKEIINSPNTKFIPLRSPEPLSDIQKDLALPPVVDNTATNGITLPPIIPGLPNEDKSRWVSRRRHRRSSSVRTRSQRKTFYEDLDSSLSADPGDGSIIVTAAKITAENMPRRNIFPEYPSKKVHFTPVNPFVESDESVTLTFYELENVDSNGYQVPRNEQKVADINKFKYLDLEKLTSEKRAAMISNANHSPSKQPKYTKKSLCDITNTNLKRSPSKASLTSKSSNSSRYSMASTKSHWSMESAVSKTSTISKVSTVSKTSAMSKVSQDTAFERTRASRQSMAAVPQTPAVEKKAKRKSLLPFKTPFKFMTSAKIV